MHPLKEIFAGLKGGQKAVFSVCTANPLVLRAAMMHAKKYDYILVIEATANQVNQYGGYTGMTPADYAALIEVLRTQVDLKRESIILGGDHLGPLTWQNLTEAEAMENSMELVRAYTMAGFTKIHLDTSMRVADDDSDTALDVRVCARRGAQLANCVFQAYEERKRLQPDALRPVLIIGSEVPIPGGSKEHEDSITPTTPEEFYRQYNVFSEEFEKAGVAFEDVIAFVVQPGVEFGDDFVFQYDAERVGELCQALIEHAPLVFEGHSTDYQTTESLSHMTRDGIRILKVGPALTFGLREALFLLEECEKLIVSDHAERSRLKETILSVMNADDRYWKKYYQGTNEEVEYKKLYSYSDRCRYYLPDEKIGAAIDTLLTNTSSVPHALVSLYFPRQYEAVLSNKLSNDGLSLVLDRLGNWCDAYAIACGIKAIHSVTT